MLFLKVAALFGWNLIIVIFTPIVLGLINVKINTILASEDPYQNILTCIICKIIYDGSTYNFGYRMSRALKDALILELNMAKIKCGVVIPSVNNKQHRELIDDQHMLQDILWFVPMIWSAVVNFAIAVYNFETGNGNRVLYVVGILVAVYFTSKFTDYNYKDKDKPNLVLTKFNNTRDVQTKLALGYKIDAEYEVRKRDRQNKRHNVHRYVILCADLYVLYSAMMCGNIKQYRIFGSISWMIGPITENLKVFTTEYSEYINKYFKLASGMKKHAVPNGGSMGVGELISVKFMRASFSYYNDITNSGDIEDGAPVVAVANFSYTFRPGVYYLESPNGTGKSTLMKMFTLKLSSGSVYFNDINRDTISYDSLASTVLYLPQSSEFTPVFSHNELEQFRGRDHELEQKLHISDLFWDSNELSGGQRKRLFIYLALVSTAKIILLDEIFTEISVELQDTVVAAVVKHKTSSEKIILITGHGLREKMMELDVTIMAY